MTKEQELAFALAQIAAKCPITLDDVAKSLGESSFASVLPSEARTKDVISSHAVYATEWAEEVYRNCIMREADEF